MKLATVQIKVDLTTKGVRRRSISIVFNQLSNEKDHRNSIANFPKLLSRMTSYIFLKLDQIEDLM